MVLIILGSILGALIVLGIILFFTAFSLKNADIKFETTNEIYVSIKSTFGINNCDFIITQIYLEKQ